MKKNKMMRAASGLLVATLLTTSIISGTFAKYVTSDSASDTARVAKWGVVATVSGDLFGATYSAVENGNSIITHSTNGGTVSSGVNASDPSDFVVAPGTKNDTGMTISVSGTPEVATKVTIDEAEDASGRNYANSDIYLKSGKYGVMVKYTGTKTNDNQDKYYYYNQDAQKYTKMTAGQDISPVDSTKTWYELRVTNEQNFASLHDREDYYPINWTVDDVSQEKVSDVQAAVKTAMTYAADSNRPNDNLRKSTVVKWSWNFSDATGSKWSDDPSAGDPENTTAKDEQDTVLGNMMVGENAKVVVVESDGTCTQVNYQTVDASTKEVNPTSANTVTVAYTGIHYDSSHIVACLDVAFNTRVTVEQVD